MRMERIFYRDEDHSYWLGDRQLPSVTTLLAKHGISTDLSGAPAELVRRAGEHGTFVHEEIERFVNTGELGISDEFQDFMQMVEPLAIWSAEVIVWTDDYAGRADLIGITDDEIIVVDIKTGQVNYNSCCWQTSMYAYAFPNEARRNVKLYCFDAKPSGNSRLVELETIPDTCIEALIKADRNGEIYNPVREIITSQNTSLVKLENEIAEAEKKLKVLKESRDKFWNTVKKGMEDAHITSFETPSFKVTYVAPFSKNCVDSERLKTKYPLVYADCQKVSNVKASLRVTLREVQS